MKTIGAWNLTTPLLKTIPTKQLAGYTDAFFYHQAGWDMFRAPSHGHGITHTKNSTYPRSELRQTLLNGDVKEADWSPATPGTFVLEGDCMVVTLPKSGKLIWAQWHGQSNHPPAKGNATIKGKTINLLAQLRRTLNGVEDKPVIYADYKLGTPFHYRFQMVNWVLNIWIDGKLMVRDYKYDAKSYAKDKWYGKLGCYSQQIIDENDPTLGEGLVGHRNYTQYHDDRVSNNPETVPAAPTPPSTPVSTSGTPADRLDNLLAQFLAGQVSKSDAKMALNKIEDTIDTLPDGPAQSALYTKADQIRSKLS